MMRSLPAFVLCVGVVLCLVPSALAQELAFTWDDLPAHSSLPQGQSRVGIADAILHAMQDAKLPPAYGFVNGVRTEQEPGSEAALAKWRAAGLPLGNHTWSHMNLDQHTAAEFEAEIEKNEPLLRKYAGGSDWHWLRYPNLVEGSDPEKKAAVRQYLAEHGYRVAAVTMSFGDYAWNEPYARCVAKGDAAAINNLETTYLAAADTTIDYTRGMARSLFGHDIPYVLLMHVGALDARLLPKLLALYKARGFRFITLEQAQSDPFYKVDMDLKLPIGIDTLEGAMAARHLPLPAHPKLPDFAALCR